MWPNPQFPADLVTFTEEILNNGNVHFLRRVLTSHWYVRVNDRDAIIVITVM